MTGATAPNSIRMETPYQDSDATLPLVYSQYPFDLIDPSLAQYDIGQSIHPPPHLGTISYFDLIKTVPC